MRAKDTSRETVSVLSNKRIQQDRGKPISRIEGELDYLYIKQASDVPADMPPDGEDFDLTYRPFKIIEFFNIQVRFTAGTFSVRLKIDGVLFGPTITNASATITTIDPVILYDGNDSITLHVNSSANCEQFHIIYTGRLI